MSMTKGDPSGALLSGVFDSDSSVYEVEASAADNVVNANAFEIDLGEENIAALNSSNSQRISSFGLILAIITNCIQGQFFTLPQPTMVAGMLPSLITIVVIGAIFTYTAQLQVKYFRPNDSAAPDQIISELFPIIKIPLQLVSRTACWILYTFYLIQAAIYVNDLLNTLLFYKFSNWNNNYTIIVMTFLMFAVSFVTNTKMAVLLCSWTCWIPVVSISITIYLAIKLSTHESVQCWKDSFTTLKTGDWNVNMINGWGALLTFAGVMQSCFFEHYSLACQLSTAEKPQHNRRNVQIAFAFNALAYIIVCAISPMPYACYNGINPSYAAPPSDFSTLMGTDTLSQVAGWIFLFGTLVGSPYSFLICRISSVDLLPYKKYEKLQKNRKWIVWANNAILCIICAVTIKYNVSLATANQVGAALSSVLFAWLLPAVIDIYMREYKSGARKVGYWILYGIIGFVIVSVTIVQFCMPSYSMI